MASNVVTSSNFNVQKISFSAMKSLDSGGKQAYVNYDGGMFVMQTANCALPFGLNAFDKAAGPVKYSVEIALRGHDEPDSSVGKFYKTLVALDDYMIDQGVRNSKAWFKSDLSRDVIKAFYSPMARYGKDKDGNVKPYPPNVKLNIRKKRDSEDFDVQCYDDQRNLYRGIPLEELLVRNTQMTALIQCTGVWIAGSKFGLSWKLVQSMITSLPQSKSRFTFVDDGDLEDSYKGKKAPAQGTKDIGEDQEEQEEEEEEEEEQAEEFVPPPTKSKSVVSAMMPTKSAPPPAESLDDAEDDAEPIPVPKKATTKVVMKKSVPKAK
jgi:hypothetical protein